ncbi:MAG: hypothetical protein AB1437_13690 [Pseudomonadota bacterium]
MSRQPDDNIIDDAWDSVVGGLGWLKSVLIGEFADNRPLSAVVADMLVSFVPGVVLVTSARDAIAVTLRLANHPDKRNDLMEWVLLCACLIVLALPIAMAAGGAAAAGVGAIVGGIAGSELGAALRAVMLMLIKEANKLVELVRFLQKFIKGDILKFLRAIKFAQYQKPLLAALDKTIQKLLEIVRGMRRHLHRVNYFDSLTSTITTLVAWEKKFYAVQQDALRQIPKALAVLDARLAKVLAQTAPKEVHTVASGVKAKKPVAPPPATQRVRDVAGRPLAKPKPLAAESAAKPAPAAKPKPKPAAKPAAAEPPKPPLKDKPDPVKPPDESANTKKQEVIDAAVEADRVRITQLSNEMREAEKAGDTALAAAKRREAQDILRPHFPRKNSTDTWDEVIKRLDVSSPKDGAVFWSGDDKAAQKYAESIGGVTLETTPGGRIIDGWKEINVDYPWDKSKGTPPFARDLWAGVSKKYAEGVTGHVNAVQTLEKLDAPYTLWHNVEKPIYLDKYRAGEVSGINVFALDPAGNLTQLGEDKVKALLALKGTAPWP